MRAIKRLGFVAAICAIMLSSTSMAAPVPQQAAVHSVALQQAAMDWATKEAQAYHWKVDSVTVSNANFAVTANQQTGHFLVKTVYHLNYATADDSPAVQGRLAFLAASKQLTNTQRQKVANDIKAWRDRLASYISTPQYATQWLKVTAPVLGSGQISLNGLQVYVEGWMGDYIPGDQFLSSIPSPAQVKSEAFKGESAIANAPQANTSASPTPSVSTCCWTYNASNAVQYANT